MSPKPVPPVNSNLPVPEMIRAAFYACGYQETGQLDEHAFEFTKYDEQSAHVVTVMVTEETVKYNLKREWQRPKDSTWP